MSKHQQTQSALEQPNQFLLDLDEAAEFFRVSRTTFYELRKSPKFPAPVRIMGKTLFLAEDLKKYALSRKVEKRC